MIELQLAVAPIGKKAPQMQVWGMLFLSFAFVLCIGLMIIPIQRMASIPLVVPMHAHELIARWGSWFPTDLHLAQDPQISQTATNNVAFLFLIAVAYLIYGLSAFWLGKQIKSSWSLLLIWTATIMTGLMFVSTPAMLSKDLFVYADYGHVITTYHANPFFVAPNVSSHDAITLLDDWRGTTAAYGPIWLYLCSALSLFLGNNPLHYFYVYRLLGLTCHLLNTLLVFKILCARGCGSYTSRLGILLYAWNPLALLESSMGAHNDVFMSFFMLLGILFCVRAEQKDLTQLRNYLLPLCAFACATLIKFTGIPLMIFFLILLVCKTLYRDEPFSRHSQVPSFSRILVALRKLVLASLIYAMIVLALYLPFWVGHSLKEIVHSFTAPPSSYGVENSILRAFIDWIKYHGLPPHNTWNAVLISLLSQRSVWNIIDVVVLIATFMLGAICLWRVPTTSTLILVSLVSMGALLVVTPWFYGWYVIWLIGLAVAVLAQTLSKMARSLIVFTMIFSATAFFTYFDASFLPSMNWGIWRPVFMLVPPLFVSLLLFFVVQRPHAIRYEAR